MAKHKADVPVKYALFVRINPSLGRKLNEKAEADRRSIATTVEIIFEQYFGEGKFVGMGNERAPKAKVSA